MSAMLITLPKMWMFEMWKTLPFRETLEMLWLCLQGMEEHKPLPGCVSLQKQDIEHEGCWSPTGKSSGMTRYHWNHPSRNQPTHWWDEGQDWQFQGRVKSWPSTQEEENEDHRSPRWGRGRNQCQDKQEEQQEVRKQREKNEQRQNQESSKQEERKREMKAWEWSSHGFDWFGSDVETEGFSFPKTQMVKR